MTDPAPATTFAHLDATTVLSRGIAELGIYPAVDPLDSKSRMLDPRVVGQEHYDIASQVQRILQDYKGLQDIIAILGMDELSEEDKLTVERARKLQRFMCVLGFDWPVDCAERHLRLTRFVKLLDLSSHSHRAQPFAVAEIFTGIEGKLVSLKDSIKSFKSILNGEGDSFPESGAYAWRPDGADDRQPSTWSATSRRLRASSPLIEEELKKGSKKAEAQAKLRKHRLKGRLMPRRRWATTDRSTSTCTKIVHRRPCPSLSRLVHVSPTLCSTAASHCDRVDAAESCRCRARSRHLTSSRPRMPADSLCRHRWALLHDARPRCAA